MEVVVFFPVVVGKLFARPYCTEGEDSKSTTTDPDLAVRSTRVVDEASDIRLNVSVDHGLVTRPEEVLPAILPQLFGRGGASDVFDDERTFGYALLGEKPLTTVRSKDC